MDWYPWIVFIHVASILLFFIAHGVSMTVAFRLKREGNPERVRMLLDLSSWSLGVAPSIAFLVGLVAGVAAGIAGGWFGQAWIWISLVLLVVISAAMTPLVAARLNVIRAAAGTRAINPFSRKPPASPPSADPRELERLLAAWNPAPAALMGFGGFLAILWLMFFKPF
jgi:uncharacterized membrane protein